MPPSVSEWKIKNHSSTLQLRFSRGTVSAPIKPNLITGERLLDCILVPDMGIFSFLRLHSYLLTFLSLVKMKEPLFSFVLMAHRLLHWTLFSFITDNHHKSSIFLIDLKWQVQAIFISPLIQHNIWLCYLCLSRNICSFVLRVCKLSHSNLILDSITIDIFEFVIINNFEVFGLFLLLVKMKEYLFFCPKGGQTFALDCKCKFLAAASRNWHVKTSVSPYQTRLSCVCVQTFFILICSDNSSTWLAVRTRWIYSFNRF